MAEDFDAENQDINPDNTVRVVATVSRGMTDKTPVVVFPWEIAILDNIHGSGACQVHTLDELSSMKGASRIINTKLKHGGKTSRTLREQLEAMLNTLPVELDPFTNPEAEYARMEGVYGMNPDVAESQVENTYGKYRAGAFKAAVLGVIEAGAKPIRADEEEEDELDESGLPDLDSMEGVALRAECDNSNVTYKANTPLTAIRERLKVVRALNRDLIDFDPNDDLKVLQDLAAEMAT